MWQVDVVSDVFVVEAVSRPGREVFDHLGLDVEVGSDDGMDAANDQSSAMAAAHGTR